MTTRLTTEARHDAGQRDSSAAEDAANGPAPDIQPWAGWIRVVVIVGLAALLWLIIWAIL